MPKSKSKLKRFGYESTLGSFKHLLLITKIPTMTTISNFDYFVAQQRYDCKLNKPLNAELQLALA